MSTFEPFTADEVAELPEVSASALVQCGLPIGQCHGFELFRPLRRAGSDQRLWAFALFYGQWMLCIDPDDGHVCSILTDGMTFHEELEPGETFVNSSLPQFCEYLRRWAAASARDWQALTRNERHRLVASELRELAVIDPEALSDEHCFWALHTEEAGSELDLELGKRQKP